MSWQAMTYAARLPLSRVAGGARAVLHLLAEHADEHGRGAYPAVATLAKILDVSDRSVKRYLAELRGAGLIAPGDVDLVTHLRADRRPQVWDLPELSTGVTPAVTPSPSDDVTPVVTPPGHGVTGTGARGDRYGSNGVTAAVLQNHPRTTQEPPMHASAHGVTAGDTPSETGKPHTDDATEPETTTALAATPAPPSRRDELAAVILAHPAATDLDGPEAVAAEHAGALAAAGWQPAELAARLRRKRRQLDAAVSPAALLRSILRGLAADGPPVPTPTAGPAQRCPDHGTSYHGLCSACRADVLAGQRDPGDVAGTLDADALQRYRERHPMSVPA